MQQWFSLFKQRKIDIFKELSEFCKSQYQYKMTQYNTLNIKLSNSQLNKLKSRIKSVTEAILNLLSNVSAKSNEDTNFPYRLLLTDRQVLKPRKAFANN